MTIEGLSSYLEDLVKIGFVSKFSKNGKLYYKLAEMGLKSGLKNLPMIKSQNGFEDNTGQLEGKLIKQNLVLFSER